MQIYFAYGAGVNRKKHSGLKVDLPFKFKHVWRISGFAANLN